MNGINVNVKLEQSTLLNIALIGVGFIIMMRMK